MTLRPLALLAAALLSSLALQAQITGKFYFVNKGTAEGHRAPAIITFQLNGKTAYANYTFGGQKNGVDQCTFKADSGDSGLVLQRGMKILVKVDEGKDKNGNEKSRTNDYTIDQDVDSPENASISIYMEPGDQPEGPRNGFHIRITITNDKFMSDLPGMS